MLIGLSILWGEYSDRSAHPSFKESLCSHDGKAFDALLLHHTLHINDVVGLGGLSLIGMGRNIRHALADGIGPPAEIVRYGVPLS